MAEYKHAKYIVTEPKTDMNLPQYRVGALEAQKRTDRPSTRVMWLDDQVIRGAFYTECVWLLPGRVTGKPVVEAHVHSFDEIVAFFGTNYEDLHDLGGEIELWLEDEKILMTRNFLAFIPAGMKHCPLVFRKVDRPIFHLTVGTGKEYR